MRSLVTLCLLCTLGCGGSASKKAGSHGGSGAADGGGGGVSGNAGKGGHAAIDDDDAGMRDAGAMVASSQVCSVDGFCWELPLPQGENLRAVWGAAANDIWAVGDGGVVLHYDGNGFSAAHVSTHEDLLAIHGTSANDVWAVGNGSDVLHYDGSSWSVQDLSMLIDSSGGAMTGAMYGVFALAKDAVWAVGHSGVGAAILNYDGQHWTSQSPNLQTDQALRAVWGVSRDHVWAVGDAGVIRSFDGTQWNVDKSPTQAALSSVHGLVQDDVWAVGASGTAVHWNGTVWSSANTGLTGASFNVRVDIAMPPPAADAGMPAMQPSAAGAGAGAGGADAGLPKPPQGPWSVWCFGDNGRVARYNGTVWAPLASGTELGLYGAARISSGSLMAVGERGQITRFMGDSRQSLSTGSRSNHLALWSDGQTLWSVGDDIASRDTTGWSAPIRPSERALYGVWGDTTGIWAVGTLGTVLHYKANAWQAVQVNAAGESWLHGVWGAGSSVWMVGDAGLALVSAAGSFVQVTTPVHSNLLDVWGTADDQFWAVGEGGTVLHWDGMAWLTVPTGPMGGVLQNLRAVWGSADDDVWVVGTASTILHWNGQRFDQQSPGKSYSLNDVWGRSKNEVYAVGSGGIALRYDGTHWNELQTGTSSSLQSVFGDAHGHVFAAGLDGATLVLGD